jgi:hypothetical protein
LQIDNEPRQSADFNGQRQRNQGQRRAPDSCQDWMLQNYDNLRRFLDGDDQHQKSPQWQGLQLD